jgi:serine/threonine protein kinase
VTLCFIARSPGCGEGRITLEQSSPQDSNATSWGERWTFVRSLESGNQGLALEAVDAAGVRAFIKVLPKKTSKERRARFSREVRILGDLAIPGIPRLIESNAAHAADKSYELFLAAEFIVGRRLHEVVSEGISGSAAVDLTLKIVRIVKAAHAVDVLHRDIKPDNVVIREDAGVLTPFLVDFGMAHIDEPDGFATHNSQEVGNRFMRLPEYNSGFDNKQDPRSDYTFCVGLLFFMLTKTNPSALLDESNNPPHQRRVERLLLRESGLDEDRLLRFFDIGFQNDITKRFQTPEDLIAGLEGLLTTQPADPIDAEAIAAKLRNRFMTPARQSQRDAAVTAQARLQEGEVALKLVLR